LVGSLRLDLRLCRTEPAERTVKKKPWMQFYPADWRAEPRLRMCSLAARGLWIDLMTYMHEGEPYGHFTIEGLAPDLDGMASLVSRPLDEVEKALAELEAKRVFSRTESGVIFSRRMVRDRQKAEADADNGKLGGNPKLNGGLTPPDNGGLKAQIPYTKSQTSLSSGSSGGKDGRSQSGPRHGATSEQRRRVFIKAGTQEWEDYAADFRAVHFKDPVPNEYGGKWFNTSGEKRHAG
jgi:hypothetical protein